MVVIDGQVNVVCAFQIFPTKLSNISPVLTKEKKTHLLVCIISRLQEQCQIPLYLKALSPHRVLLN